MYHNTNLAFVDDFFEFREEKFLRKSKKRKKRGYNNLNTNLILKQIEPKTDNQSKTFEYYSNDHHLFLQGVAGTGKTFISIFLSMRELLSQFTTKNKLVLVRSVVPTRDMGFLPGNQKEKQKAYELPYYSIFNELFGRGDAYDYLKNRGMVDFISTSFVRGTTFNDCIIIIDECQNLDWGELDTIVTRVGKNCRIIFSGDFRQSDLERHNEKSGFIKFMNIIKNIESFKTVDFNENDIVRSDLVKEYIIAKIKNGIYT